MPLFGNTEKHICRNALLKFHSIKLHPKNPQTVKVVLLDNTSEVDLAPREAQMYVHSGHLRTALTLAQLHQTRDV